MSSVYTRSVSTYQDSKNVRRRLKYMNKDAVNALLLCSVCGDPFIDPVTDRNKRRGCRWCFSTSDGPLTDITEWIVIEMLNGLLVECTQCGETNIRRDALETHEQTVCKQAMVLCKAADIKCTWKGPRAQLDQHLIECIFEPLRPALAEIINENKKLHEKVERLERLLEELKEQQ